MGHDVPWKCTSSRLTHANASCVQFARAQQPTPSDPYGLMGLLGVIRMQDPDLTTLALGTDLTGLGLHLNSPENVYSTFASPWAEQPLKAEPEFFVSSAEPLSKSVQVWQSLRAVPNPCNPFRVCATAVARWHTALVLPTGRRLSSAMHLLCLGFL